MEKVEDYVLKKKWEYHVQGDEFVLTVCPICGDTGGHFNFNKLMGVWRCFKCGERGNLFTLKQQLGDLEVPSAVEEAFGEEVSFDVIPKEEYMGYHNQLLNDEATRGWLYGRGIADSLIKSFVIGVSYEDDGRYITFPYFKDGECVNMKFRSVPPLPKQFRSKHKKAPLYNHDQDDQGGVLIVEGEMDCLSAYMMGFSAFGLPQGADHFSSDHWDRLVGFKRVSIVLDPDVAGREGAEKVARRLGEERCYNVKIPNGMDVNDLLTKYGAEGGQKRLLACIKDAKQFGRGEVASAFGALQELDDHISKTGSVESGFATPWCSVNRVCGLISPGEVLLLQAIPKTGKTTLALQWLSWLAQNHSVPSLMYCLEMPLWRLAQSLTAMTTSMERTNITTLEVKMTMLRFRNVPFYFGVIPKSWDFEHIEEVITYSVRRFGVQFVCFDNLQLLCRSTTDLYKEQAVVSRNFKRLAEDLGVAVLLVVQPRKMNPKSMPGIYDPSGSGSLIADADGMMTMWRKPLYSSEEIIGDEQLQTESTESFAPETLVRVPASRYRPGGQTVLHFNGKEATFSEIAEQGPNL